MKKYHEIGSLEFLGDNLNIEIDKKRYSFSLSDLSAKLKNASESELATFEISPSGYGIHWPLLDEDLSIDGMLGITHSPQRSRKKATV